MADPTLPTQTLLQNAAAGETLVNKATEDERKKTRRSNEKVQHTAERARGADEVPETEEIVDAEGLPHTGNDEERNRHAQLRVVLLRPQNEQLPTTEEALPIIEETHEEHENKPAPNNEELEEEYEQEEPLDNLGNLLNRET